jgi:MscS family membrane protein
MSTSLPDGGVSSRGMEMAQRVLPAPLLEVGPWGLVRWQLLALPVVFIASMILGNLLARLTRAGVSRITKRTGNHWDDDLVQRAQGPFTVAWALLLTLICLPWLGLSEDAYTLVTGGMRTLFFLAFFWMLVRAVRVGGQYVSRSHWALSYPSSRALVPLAARLVSVFVVAMAVVALLSDLGYPVASLVAGLGISGIAVALAAQKTVENLFGSFSIGIDQPFTAGDVVKVEDFTGTVESIGLRSTRFRTADRTLITMPNGKLSEMRVESYTARDRLRLSCVLGLTYGTRAEQVKQVIHEVEQALLAHPKLHSDGMSVWLRALGTSALEIEVGAWFRTTDWNEFQEIRQELLLKFLEIVEAAKSELAFPTQTLVIQPK